MSNNLKGKISSLGCMALLLWAGVIALMFHDLVIQQEPDVLSYFIPAFGVLISGYMTLMQYIDGRQAATKALSNAKTKGDNYWYTGPGSSQNDDDEGDGDGSK